MEFLDLMGISHRDMELLNPSSAEKILKLGKVLKLKEGSRVIDFGCGCAEPLVLWAQEFGITATGIDISADFCERARRKVEQRGLADRLEIVCSSGTDYCQNNPGYAAGSYDVATCLGATFIFGGYAQTIQALRSAVKPGGRLGIGETCWLNNCIHPEYAQKQPTTRSEAELLKITRTEGFELEYVLRASPDEWERYQSDSWFSLLRWLEENPTHPDHTQVFQFFRESQDDYLQFQRQYMGWAMFCLAPSAAYSV